MAHNMSPQAINPTAKRTIQLPTQKLEILSVWLVTPKPPGRYPMSSCYVHPVIASALTAARGRAAQRIRREERTFSLSDVILSRNYLDRFTLPQAFSRKR
jgi:hypothetical protein